MVDLSLVEPGMHLKVVDKMDSVKCVSVDVMTNMQGKIVTCQRKVVGGSIARRGPSNTAIYVDEVLGCIWNDNCFEYIVEFEEYDTRDFVPCDMAELFA